MVIKRGGGPGGPRLPPRTQAEQQQPVGPSSAEPQRAEEARATAGFDTASFDSDGFDDELVTQRSTPGERTEDLFRSEARSSAVKNTQRLLETTYERLAQDFRAVESDARALVAGLADEGFAPEAVAGAREELEGHRARMSKVRGRLATIRRRLRAMSLPTGSALDVQLQQRLGAQIQAVADLERGADRTLMALQLATTFRPRGADGRAAALVRLDVEGAHDRAALGSELARHAPDATSTDTMLRLLTGGAATREAPAPRGGASDVEALRAFAAAQLGT